MKQILLLPFLLLSVAAFSQKEGVKKEGAHQAEYNANSEVRDRSADIDSRNATSENDDHKDPNTTSDADNEGEGNNGTDVRTTSSAGSPSVLTEDDQRDGTNTKQSATLNIAGSPLPGHGGKVANDAGKRAQSKSSTNNDMKAPANTGGGARSSAKKKND